MRHNKMINKNDDVIRLHSCARTFSLRAFATCVHVQTFLCKCDTNKANGNTFFTLVLLKKKDIIFGDILPYTYLKKIIDDDKMWVCFIDS